MRPLPAKLEHCYLYDPCIESKIWHLTFSSITTKRYVVDSSNYIFFWIVITRGICWYGSRQHWSNFWIWPLHQVSCDPQVSCTGCDPAAIWNSDSWTHTNKMKLSNLLFLFSWLNFASVRPTSRWSPHFAAYWWAGLCESKLCKHNTSCKELPRQTLTLKCLGNFSLPFGHKEVHLDPTTFKQFPERISVQKLHYIYRGIDRWPWTALWKMIRLLICLLSASDSRSSFLIILVTHPGRLRSKVIQANSGSPALYGLQFIDKTFSVRFPHTRWIFHKRSY